MVELSKFYKIGKLKLNVASAYSITPLLAYKLKASSKANAESDPSNFFHCPFNAIVNVPSDGWCLIYAFQMAYFIEYGVKYKIEYIFKRLVASYLSFIACDDNLNFAVLQQSNLGKVLGYREETRDNLLLTSKYQLVQYVLSKRFGSELVDFIPKLIADAFSCVITVYEYDAFREELVTDNYRTFLPFIRTEHHSKSTKCVNILYLRKSSHYFALTVTNCTHDRVDYIKLSNLIVDMNELFFCFCQHENEFNGILKNLTSSKLCHFIISLSLSL